MDNNFILDLGISFVLSVLRSVVKNPKSKATMKKAFLKVFTSIKNAYADDPDFA